MICIHILNGPNLNLLGQREPNLYGNRSMSDFWVELKQRFPGHAIELFQANREDALIDLLHESAQKAHAVVLNAGAYTHTSLALGDAVKAIDIPVVEVHISNVFSREEIRHHSFIAAGCIGSSAGFGLESYALAVQYLVGLTQKKSGLQT